MPPGTVAVIFTSQRTVDDAAGYARAAAAMDALAARQPGYLAAESARDSDGFGITVSYWRSEADALARRAEAEHQAIRRHGREQWYSRYRVVVTRIERSYAWHVAPLTGSRER